MLTVLTLMRGVRVPPVLDVSPIVSEATGVVSWQWKRLVKGFWREIIPLEPKTGAQPLWEGFHLAVKKGPGGRVALMESLDNLFSLPDSLLSSIKTLGGEGLSLRMD